ncbi:hypothetical protein AHAS_Ahas19G0078400 [Arachis hypogaea]
MITGSVIRIKASSALAAEAMAVRNALIISKNMQMEKVIIETDSLTLTQAVKSKGNIGEIQPILQDINLLMENFDKCGMTWVPREETVRMIMNREAIRASPMLKEQITRVYASNLENEVDRRGDSEGGSQGPVGRGRNNNQNLQRCQVRADDESQNSKQQYQP